MALFVPIDTLTQQRLNALARQEKRRPQEQAAILIETALGIRSSEPTGKLLHLADYQRDDRSDPAA